LDLIESRFPKPLKPKFRYLRRRKRLTTVIAVQCRDGVVLCSDSQETTEYAGLGTKELVSKIRPVSYNDEDDSYCLLGCSGMSPYINWFREHVGEAIFKREGRSYLEALRVATRNYAKNVNMWGREIGLRFGEDFSNLASAIFVGYEARDHKTRVYILAPPDPPDSLSTYPYRVAIGTGGLYASLVFNIAELLMNKIGFGWTQLSTKLVSQFSYLVLGRIISYDAHSGMGTAFYRVDGSGYATLSVAQIFPGLGEEGKSKLSILFETLRDEIPKEKNEKLLEVAQKYDVAGIVKQILLSINARSVSER